MKTKTVTRLLLAVLTLAVIAAAAFVVWKIADPSVEAVALQPQGLAVLSAAAGDLGQTRAEQNALLEALPQAVLDAGCDTLYFTVNTPEGVAWRDRRFVPDPRLQKEVLFGLAKSTFDALDYLGNTCAAAGVRLVAVLDVDDLAGTACDTALADETFVHRLQQAVRQLSERSVSGVVLRLGAASDNAVNRAALSSAARGCALPFGLEQDAAAPLLYTAETGAQLLVARVSGDADARAAVQLTQAAQQNGQSVIWKAEDALSFSAAAYYAASQGQPLQSCCWAPVRQTVLQPDTFSQLTASVDATLLADVNGTVTLPAPPQQLAVAYPAEGATIYTRQVFIMGTSDPATPLLLDGETVPRTAQNGMFGILVELEEGENTFTFSQGGATLPLHITLPIPEGGGGGGGATAREHDDTLPLLEGDRIQITEWICSVLNDPYNEDSIKETAKEGGVAVVNRRADTVRGGKDSYVYELTTGGWVWGGYCQKLEEPVGPWPLADFSAVDDGRDERLLLVAGGQALGYDSWDEAGGRLTVTLANTTLDEAATLPLDSHFVSRVECQPVDGGVQLTFAVAGDRQLWGYDVCYEDGNTLLYLKGTPQLPLEGAQPLRGAVILLDAGHGGDDNGAMGLGGFIGGAREKDLNLAVARVTRTRLEQLGATVLMTREGDDTVSLEDRSRQAEALYPDIFLAVHHNSVELYTDANRASGAAAYYFTLQGKQLADALLGPVALAGGRSNNGSNWSYFYVTRMTYAPAVLFEYGFLVNPAEYAACCDPLVILQEGDATARAILSYFTERLA